MKEILVKYMTRHTSLSQAEQQSILEELIVQRFKKGTYLIKQGDSPTKKCFFVLKGCVRQFHIENDGKEVTTNFYTEEQPILLFNFEEPEVQTSEHSLICVEECLLVVADLESQQEMYQQYSELETMTRRMMETYLSHAQNDFAKFVRASPEERYKTIIRNRPDLPTRIPQHQLASYLGITPESLSRIKKRIQ
ncbi:Crp/Fnr family transcriptional regulator [Lysinibacillus sp. BW-2-10]|uniref:Crp/Fnr family transcriptional regulator n=1 Tax=Lysinibacillus sp. BW-2-10 TaxID=2590030 RepID=UPI00117F6F6A|nr:Crp/Fnr family transcriptional regulator [Lysinibacillus sp. BW-2-10]TSI04750.1 Crp/Fnr family transcriptional regulator [Lysinibacillus sp. BW-2-10]